MSDKYNWHQWKETALSNGINRNLFVGRIKLGWNTEDAATTTKEKAKGRKPDKYNWRGWKHVAVKHGVDKTVYRNRRAIGWDEEAAATTPRSRQKRITIDEDGRRLNVQRSNYHAVYRNRDCIFIGTKSECEEFLGVKYRTEHGEHRIDDNTIIFDIELEDDELLEAME